MRQFNLTSVIRVGLDDDPSATQASGGGPGSSTRSIWDGIRLGYERNFRIMYVLLVNRDELSDSWSEHLLRNVERIHSATASDSLLIHTAADRRNPQIMELWEEVRREDPVTRRDWHLPALMVIDRSSVNVAQRTFEPFNVLLPPSTYGKLTIDHFFNQMIALPRSGAGAEEIARSMAAHAGNAFFVFAGSVAAKVFQQLTKIAAEYLAFKK